MRNGKSGGSRRCEAAAPADTPFAIPHSRLHLYYGGTFDPFHNGHLAIARSARDELDTQVWLMPAADPPHRAAPGASAAQRMAMLELGIAGETGLRVDDRELRRAGRDPGSRSYTVDTLRELRGELGADARIALLLGADSFAGLPDWRQWRELFDLAHFVVAERPGSPLDGALPVELAEAVRGRWVASGAGLLAVPAGGIYRLRQPLRAESATDIRRRVAADQPWRDLAPPAVARYIALNGLYRSPAV